MKQSLNRTRTSDARGVEEGVRLMCVCGRGGSNRMTADVTELKRDAKTGRMEFLALR